LKKERFCETSVYRFLKRKEGRLYWEDFRFSCLNEALDEARRWEAAMIFDGDECYARLFDGFFYLLPVKAW
jgi:hypothetical protein